MSLFPSFSISTSWCQINNLKPLSSWLKKWTVCCQQETDLCVAFKDIHNLVTTFWAVISCITLHKTSVSGLALHRLSQVLSSYTANTLCKGSCFLWSLQPCAYLHFKEQGLSVSVIIYILKVPFSTIYTIGN